MHETMAPMVKSRCATVLALVSLLGTTAARGQTQPPPATTAPPSDPSGTAPPAASPSPTPPAAFQPITPLSPTLAPEPAPAPPLVLTQRTTPEQQPPRPEPLHQKTWFWAVIGVAFATSFVITWMLLRDKANEPPDTTFGNMNAF